MNQPAGDERASKHVFGSRGEWWVVAQFTLGPVFVVVTWLTRGQWSATGILAGAGTWIGLTAAVIAAVFLLGGILSLGRNLTAVPKPIAGGELVETGLYRVVRHPIYAGVIFGAFAWALLWGSLVGLALSAGAFLFFDRKSRLEESWLVERYPGYDAYRRRVKKLVPFVY